MVALAVEHTHHWLIEEPKGPTCCGACQGCGEQRTFATTCEETEWMRDEDANRMQPFRSHEFDRPVSKVNFIAW